MSFDCAGPSESRLGDWAGVNQAPRKFDRARLKKRTYIFLQGSFFLPRLDRTQTCTLKKCRNSQDETLAKRSNCRSPNSKNCRSRTLGKVKFIFAN